MRRHDTEGPSPETPRGRSRVKPAQDEEADPGRSEHTLESLQRAAGNSAVQSLLTPADGRLVQPTDTGTPLPASLRRRAERRLEADLSGVRLHTGSAAAEYADRLGAEAVTVGQDVFLREGAAGQSPREEPTLMHELTHVAQAQGSAAPARAVSRPRAPAEREAAQVAEGGLQGATLAPAEAAAAGVAHRQVVVDEEEVQAEVPAETEAAPSREVAAGEEAAGEPPSTPSQSRPLATLFESSVVAQIRAAREAIDQEPPNVERAASVLRFARDNIRNVARTYRESDPTLYNRLWIWHNGLLVTIVRLDAMAGRGAHLDQVRADLDASEGPIAELVDLLH